MRAAVAAAAFLVVVSIQPAGTSEGAASAANGALAYVETHVMRSRFDTPHRYICAGRPAERLHQALPSRRVWREQPAFAPDGRRLAYVAKTAGGLWGALTIYEFSTRLERGVFAARVNAAWPAWFPTNDRLVFSSTGGADFVGNIDIYSVDQGGSGLTRLTTGAGEDTMPAVSPDGTRIAYVYAVASRSELWVMNADGTGHTPLVGTLENVANPSWSPDGETIVFGGSPHPRALGVGDDGYRVRADGSGLSRFSPTGGESDPEYSPDGSLIAFVRGESIWTRRGGDGHEERVVSAPLGLAQPTWQPLTGTATPPVGRDLCAIKGSHLDDVIVGTPADDVIVGGPGDDRIRALGGDDLVWTGTGADTVDAGAGHDEVRIESSRAVVHAGSGNDRVFGLSGGHSISGQAGNDLLEGGSEGDAIDGGDGTDWLYGRRGNDRLAGGNEPDMLFGGAGRDSLQGGDDDDVLIGFGIDPGARLDDRADALRGGAGDDYLSGGRGADLLHGQSGRDALISRDGFADLVLGGLGLDRAWIDFRDRLRGVEACPRGSAPPAPGPRAARGSRAASPSRRCRPRR